MHNFDRDLDLHSNSCHTHSSLKLTGGSIIRTALSQEEDIIILMLETLDIVSVVMKQGEFVQVNRFRHASIKSLDSITLFARQKNQTKKQIEVVLVGSGSLRVLI